MLREYDNMKEEINKLEKLIKFFNILTKQCYDIALCVEKIQKVKTQKL